MNMAPPGRASNSAIGLPTIFGPHHFWMCSGFVNTSKTRSRGASKTRSTTSSLIGISTTLSLGAMSSLLLLQFLDVVVQSIESLLPDDAIALDPRAALRKTGEDRAPRRIGQGAEGEAQPVDRHSMLPVVI